MQPNKLTNKAFKKKEETFSKQDMQMVKKHMKRFSTSLIIREMQIQTTMRHYFKPIRIAGPVNKQIKNKITNADKDVEKLESLCIVDGNINDIATI